MKKRIKTLILTALIGIMSVVTVSASEGDTQWQTVKFKMAVPEGTDIPAPVYVMYTGADTDLFAELSSENSFETEVKALPGTYQIYQIVPSFETDLTFMGTSTFVADGKNPQINIYIKGADGIINEDATGGETPSDLATYGELIASQVEAEQQKEQQELQREQDAAASEQFSGEGTLSTQPQEQAPAETEGNGERQTKINTFTGTEDAKSSITGLVVIIAAILGVGFLVIIAVLVRKYKTMSGGKKSESTEQKQNPNSIGNK